MACSKYTLTNTGTTTVNFNYRRCDDSMWEYQVSLDPNQTKNIWLINGTYDTAQVYESSIVLVNDGAYPLTPTPTRTQTSTPTPTGTPNPTTTPTGTPNPTPTPTVTNTPTNTNSPTPTVTNTPTNTNSQTPTLTPTNTVTPTITPTNTETPTNTPTNTVTPSITPTNTPTPSATPTIEYIQLANTTWTGFTQQDFQNWLISGGTIPNVNNNPNAVVTAFNNTSGDITASIYNVTNINILQQTSFTGVTQLPDSLTSFNASFVNLPSLPTLSATSLTNLVLNYNTVITTLPELPSTISTLQIAGALNLTSLPELSGTSLQYLLAYNTQLSSLSSLPGSLTILDIHDCSFTTSTLDDAALSFIGSGSLPKTYWASGNQSTGDQPSSGVQTQLTTNVTTVDL